MFVPDSHSSVVSGIHLDISGPPSEISVLLVHGTLDRAAGMARLAREIHRYATVIRYDRRGYARSNGLAGERTIESHIHDLVEIVGDRQVFLIGHSFGGNVALGAAERIPQQVLGVSTYETPLSWMSWWSGQSAGAAAIASSTDEAAENFMIRLIGRKRWEALPDKTKDERRKEGPTLVAELTSLRLGPPWDPKKILCPVLAGVGTKASDHHRRGAEWIAESVTNGKLEVLQDAGHGAPISHAGEFVRQLVWPHLERHGITYSERQP